MPYCTMAVSPCSTITSSSGTPNSSAAIWAKVVSSPWPCGEVPVMTVTLPDGSILTVALSHPPAGVAGDGPNAQPTPAHRLQQVLAAAVIPGVDGIDRGRSHDLLYLRERLALEFQAHELAAPVAETAHRLGKPLQHLLAFHVLRRIGVQIRQLNIGNRNLGVLTTARRFAALADDLEAHDLEGKRQQIFHAFQVGVLFVQQQEHLLCQILGDVPR